jgi:hypothetical protein
MDVTVGTRPELVSGVSDLRHVPLGDLARTREAHLDHALAGAPDPSADRIPAAAFNSSI